ALSLQAWAISHDMHWQTMVFNFLCLGQMAHVLAIRSEKQSFFQTGLFSNKWLIGSVLLTFVLQLAITYLPFLHSVFKTESLTLHEFFIVGGTSAMVFVAVEIEKLVKRTKK
ncbi:MAG TPA: cation-translocating P-type ATPase C-terminal domain-containing protein, partial [Saprospiraceae bacterium]|nr:cation-translocating P-type ATPase C-terminal domain-containing protein [Saprospiraceae bacterium]